MEWLSVLLCVSEGEQPADERFLDMSYLDTIVPESDSLLVSSYLEREI